MGFYYMTAKVFLLFCTTIQTFKTQTLSVRYHRLALLTALLVTGLAYANTFPPVKHPNRPHKAFSISPLNTPRVNTAQANHAFDSADLFVDFNWFSLTTCLPHTVQFIDNSIAFNDAFVQEWIWDFGDGTGASDQYPSHDYTQNGSYTVTLTIKDTSGGAATYSQTLVVSTPTPTIQLGNDTSICAGTTITLDAGSQPGCSYIWNTGATTQTIQVTTADDYWVQVYNPTCAASAFKHVGVNPLLSSHFSRKQLGTCLPVSIQFTDSSRSCGGNITSYKWYFGDGDSSSTASPAHIFTEAKSYTVTLTVTDNTGLTVTSSQTIDINVNMPLVHLGNDTTICYGSPLLLDAGTLGDSYIWGNGATTQTITILQPGLYWVKVNKNGCSGWDSIRVKTTFPMLPDFSSEITGQCLPVTVHFKDLSAIICGSIPITGWSWDFGDGNTSTQQNPDHIYTKAGKFNVQLTLRNSANMSVTKTYEIKVVTIGPVFGLLPDVTICQGEKTQLNAGNEGSQFLWSPAGPLNNNTVHNPVAAPAITTSFIASISKCGVTVKDTVMVYVDTVPRPLISQLESGTLSCTPAASYKWYKDGKLIEGATGKTLRPNGLGYYQVGVTNTKGCATMSAKFFFLPGDGQLLPGLRGRIKLSPNPSRGMLDILFSKAPEKPVRVEIYDVFGKKVYQANISGNVNTINLGNVNKGQLFVELYVNDQKVVIPLQLL
jgi:PKD repeat protein